MKTLVAFANTADGTLLFSTNGQQHFPDASIQAGRFANIDKAKILDSREIGTSPQDPRRRYFLSR